MNPFLRSYRRVVRRHGDGRAIEDAEGHSLTHAELWRAAQERAKALRRLGVGAEDVVAIRLPRSLELVVSILATWQAGAAWMYVDPMLPPARGELLLKLGAPRVVISADGLHPTNPARTTHRRSGRAADAAGSGALAYIAFTSGSTGVPRGVRVEHRGLLPMLRAQIRAFALAPATRSLWVLSPAFDASVSDVGSTLLAGGTLLLDAADVLTDTRRLLRTLHTREVHVLDLPPGLLPHLAPEDIPRSLHTLIVGGEVADTAAVRAHARARRVVNVYGPTEATVCTSLERCSPDWPGSTLGVPLRHVRYRVEAGELWIGGSCLARDYLDDPERTNARFVRKGGERWYRTGDRVRESGGTWVFAGRVDRQVQLHGKRVEPEEVEAALREAGVEAAVIPHVRPGGTILSAFVAGPTAGLADVLHARLPSWMVPHLWVRVSALPRNAHQKIDYAALARYAISEGIAAWPDEPQARRFATLFAEVLGHAVVRADDDFFDLGGDSLAVLTLLARAESEGLPLTAAAVHAARTPAALAAAHCDGDWLSTDDLAGRLTEPARPRPRALRAQTRSDGAIVLTGATGFLGARVREALLERGYPVLSLVRAPSDAQARARVDGHEAWAVELERAQIGLSPARMRELIARASCIVHLAARVHLTDPFAALMAPNVDATRHVVALAEAAGVPLLHASTLSVFVASDRSDTVFREEDDATRSCRIAGAYAQTKWLAERVVRAARVSTCIVRYGLLTPDRRAFVPADRDWLARFVRELATSGVSPRALDTDALGFDCTPVDHATDATLRLLEKQARGTVHVSGATPVTARRLLAAMRDEGLLQGAADTMDANATRVLGAARAVDPARFERHRGLDLFAASGLRFSDARARAYGIVAPAVDDAYLRGCVRAFMRPS
jgi:amino acid adenylation domain-containing protein